MFIFTNLFAICAMTGSLFAISLAMKELYMFDYKWNPKSAWFLTVFIPMFLISVGIRDFISTVGFAGSIAGGIDGILIILMLWSAKKYGDRKPEYDLGNFRFFGTIIILVFLFGIVFQILSVLGFFS